MRGYSHRNTRVERRRSLGQLSLPVHLFVSSLVSLGSGEELVLFGFWWQEATIPRTVEELKGKSVFGRGIKEYPRRINFIYNWGGVGRCGAIPEPALNSLRVFFKAFPNLSQARLIKFSLVPLGAGTRKNPPHCHTYSQYALDFRGLS